jgi:hypothetical protein
MSDDDALSRVEVAVDEIAEKAGAGVQTFEQDNGSWVVSIEPAGDAQGTWAVTAEGSTKAAAQADLERQESGHRLKVDRGPQPALTLHALPEALCLLVVSASLALISSRQRTQESSRPRPPISDSRREIIVLGD